MGSFCGQGKSVIAVSGSSDEDFWALIGSNRDDGPCCQVVGSKDGYQSSVSVRAPNVRAGARGYEIGEVGESLFVSDSETLWIFDLFNQPAHVVINQFKPHLP